MANIPKPPARDYTGLTNYRSKTVEVESLFKRAKRVLNQQIKWLEEEMFREVEPGQKPGYRHELIRDIKDMTAQVASLGQLYLKIEEKAKAASDAMTLDEKIDTLANMVLECGTYNRKKWVRAMEALIYEVEREAKGQADDSTET